MRTIKREYTTTTYTVLESVDGRVQEVGKVVLEGGEDLLKARKKIMKQYPDKNTFIGDSVTETAVYKMDALRFLELAEKEQD